MSEALSAVVLGATGAVGSETVRALLRGGCRVTTLGRRPLELDATADERSRLTQHTVDVFDPGSYRALLPGHAVAIATFGVGQPSKVPKEEFLRVDITCVDAFATSCREAGIPRFSLMTSMGSDPTSRFDYLRLKGELEERVGALGFERVSVFQPSMLITKTNRYGPVQGLFLFVFRHANWLLPGPWRRFRGIRVEALGEAIARDAMQGGTGFERLRWDQFVGLSARSQ